jgi:hypothetical protein
VRLSFERRFDPGSTIDELSRAFGRRSGGQVMIDRFAVRRTMHGFGVWDAAVNGWHSPQDLDQAAATKLATTMNSGAQKRQPQTEAGSRKVRPAKPVLVLLDGRWWPAQLDWWVRETDGWYGRASVDATGVTNWYPAASLRPADGTNPPGSSPTGSSPTGSSPTGSSPTGSGGPGAAGSDPA